MNRSFFIFWGCFVLLTAIIWYCDKCYRLLRNVSDAAKKPYSYSRVQLAWWTVIIISSFISVYLLTGQLPTFNNSTLILLGICAGTITTATMIDASDQAKGIPLSQDEEGQNFILDILSDKNGVSIHRLQTVIFNVVIGAWFIQHMGVELSNVTDSLDKCSGAADAIANCRTAIINGIINSPNVFPVISSNNLILLGVSAGTYAAIKTTENLPGMQSAPAPANGAPPLPPPMATALAAAPDAEEAAPRNPSLF
jgi:hypothetical protein